MATILAFTSFTPAHLYPFVPLLLELRRRRHAVSLCVFTEVKRSMNLAGLPMQQILWPGGRQSAETTVAGASNDHHSLLGEPIARTVKEVIDRRRPDFVIVDPMLWGAMIAAEASAIPWASLSHNPCTIRGVDLDIRGPGYPPPRGIWQRAYFQAVAKLLRRSQRPNVLKVNVVRAIYGLPPLAELAQEYHRASLTIAATAEPFEYPRGDWPSSYRFVGPLIWEPRPTKALRLPQCDDSRLILLADTSIPRTKKVDSWVSRAVQGLQNLPFQVVATVPGGIPGPLPPNVRVQKFIPHERLLPRVACVICHGGSGITHKALAAGVPVVAVPDAYDRFEVARRVEVASAGIMLPATKLTPELLGNAVVAALGLTAGAERVAEAFRRAGGAPAAADAVEAFLGVPRSAREAACHADATFS